MKVSQRAPLMAPLSAPAVCVRAAPEAKSVRTASSTMMRCASPNCARRAGTLRAPAMASSVMLTPLPVRTSEPRSWVSRSCGQGGRAHCLVSAVLMHDPASCRRICTKPCELNWQCKMALSALTAVCRWC